MRGRDVDQRETSHPLSFVRELVIWKRRFNMEETYLHTRMGME